MKEKKEPVYRTVGKVRTTTTQSGYTNQNILVENPNHVNKDGSENQYYKGSLVWYDKETGKAFKIKQLNLSVPKNGMPPNMLEKGFSCFVSLNLEDTFHVEIME